MKIIKELYNKIWAALSAYYKKIKGDSVNHSQRMIMCFNNHLNELVVSEDCVYIECSYNYLKCV